MQSSPISQVSTWDLVAADYTREVAPVFATYANKALQLAREARPELAHVVDVATGPGTLALLAASQGLLVSALDFSPLMIDALRAEQTRRGLVGIESRVGDGMALPYPDHSFDAGFSLFGLMFFPDRTAGLRELARVLRPGAPAVLSSWAPLANNPLLKVAVEQLWELTLPPEQLDGFRSFTPPLSTEHDCRRELGDTGFSDIVVHQVYARASYPSTREMLDSFVRSSAPFALSKRNLGERFEAVHEELVARVSAQLGTGPQSVDMPAILSLGIRS